MSKLTASDINRQVSEAYQQCLWETKRRIGFGFFRSRGRYVRIIDLSGLAIGDGDSEEWKGTKKQIQNLLAECRKMGGAKGFSIEGGINHANALRDFDDFNYDPLVGAWEVFVPLTEKDWG